MKKQITLVLALLVLLLLSPAAFAQGTGDLGTRSVVDSGTCGAQGDNLTWTLYDDGELIISGSGDMADYHPSEGNTPPWYSPSVPGRYWTENTAVITSLVVEEGVSSLGEWAFRGCAALTDVSLPHSLREIRWGTFADCNTLSNLILPEGLESIASDSFSNTGLREIVFPASLKICQDEHSGDATFHSTPLMNIYVSQDSPYFCSVDGVVFSKDQETLVMFPTGRTGSYAVPAGVQSIGNKAFDASNLDTVVISDSVVSFGGFAFSSSQIRSCTIPNSVTEIGYRAFDNCRRLISVTIPGNVTSIENGVFSGCNTLTEIQVAAENSQYCSIEGCVYSKDQTTILMCPAGKGGSFTVPDFVTTIGNKAFSECSNLKIVTIPNSVSRIEAAAFNYCTGLSSVTIPDSVTAVGWSAFEGCFNLTDVYYAGLPAQWDAINIEQGNDPLQQATIHYDIQPQGVILDSGTCGAQGNNLAWSLYADGKLVISGSGDMADYSPWDGNMPPWYSPSEAGNSWGENAVVITSLVVEEGVTSLGEWAFRLCTGLTEVSLPHSLREIRRGTFDECRALSALTLPEGLESITSDSFSETGLREINFPASLKTCKDTNSFDATFHSTPLMNIYVSPDSPYFCSVDGVVFSRDQLTLVMFPTGRTGGYTVPAGVQTIGEEAFAASILDTVVFPDSVTKVREAAFFGARIRACTLPNSVKNIEYNTFTYCDSLTSIIIPDSVKDIGIYAFSYCDNLTSVTIPDSVTAIGWGAFEGCSSLTDVYYAGLPAQWNAIRVQQGNDPLQQATIHYMPWPEAQTLVLPANTTEIGAEAFVGGAFTYVRLAEQTAAIGSRAFADCAKLQYVYIPAACTEIAPDAFEGVNGLTIIGGADSAAQRFASAHGFRFLIN